MKMMFTLFSISFLSFGAAAQPSIPLKNSATTKATIDSSLNQKMILAKEFIEIGGMKKEFDMAVQSGDAFLEKTTAEKNTPPTAEHKKISAAAKIKWQNRKKTLLEEAITQLQKDLTNSFSESELKYLVELSKSQVYKKYRSFLESDSYTKFYSRPVEVARNALEETKKELGTPSPATK